MNQPRENVLCSFPIFHGGMVDIKQHRVESGSANQKHYQDLLLQANSRNRIAILNQCDPSQLDEQQLPNSALWL
jgi:hypothetical protein